jgi:cation:H+ antiporter
VNELTVNLVLIAGSVALLYFGAEWLVVGSALLARRLRIRPIVIGLTVVAFATSAPELVVAVTATIESWVSEDPNVAHVALGDVIGANVANVGLVIGGSALVAPLLVRRRTWRREVPIAILVQVFLFVFCLGTEIARWEGAFLLGLHFTFIIYMIRTAKDTEGVNLPDEVERPLGRTLWAVLRVAAGVALLAAGGYMLVRSATAIAARAGITHLTVGATLVALLTTVPEVATSIMAARRREGDIAVGNAVGSILFNTAFVLGTAASMKPIVVQDDIRYLKVPVMIGLLLVLLPMMRSKFRVSRWEGAVLLACYVGFVVMSLLTGAAD